MPQALITPEQRAPQSAAIAAGTRLRRLPILVVAGLVLGSAVVRGVIAWRHTVPRYFPDEYIYAALGRSIAQGSLAIRGSTSHFPAVLEPAVAAPLWRFFSTTTAYHLVQVENAAFASLAALPVYLIAKWLDLDDVYAVLCAVAALVLPELTIIPFVATDLVAFPIVLFTFLAGLRSLENPTSRRQVTFLALVSLSTLARVQYAVLAPAYLAAALALEHRRAPRAHRWAFLALIPAGAAVVVAVFGYYFSHGIGGQNLNPVDLGKWYLLQAFLLAVETGAVLVPGAVAAVLRPRGRREKAFACFAAGLVLLSIAVATVPAANSDRFKERYLFALIPLVVVAFGLYIRGTRLRPVVVATAALLAIAVARLPMSGYATSIYKSDSEFLFAVSWLQARLSTGTASLIVALAVTIGCIGAALVRGRGTGRVALVGAIGFMIAFSALSVREDLRETRNVRSQLPRDLKWVDHTARGAVTAIASTVAPSTGLREYLFWNPSIQQEIVLPGASATDAFNAPYVRIAKDGTILNAGSDILFDDSNATGILADSLRTAGVTNFTLWHAFGKPRLRVLITDRHATGWLGNGGSVRAWPLARTGKAVRLSFHLSLPRSWPTLVRAKFGSSVVLVRPGASTAVVCRSSSDALRLKYSSKDAAYNTDLVRVIAKMSDLKVSDIPETPRPRKAGGSCTSS